MEPNNNNNNKFIDNKYIKMVSLLNNNDNNIYKNTNTDKSKITENVEIFSKQNEDFHSRYSQNSNCDNKRKTFKFKKSKKDLINNDKPNLSDKTHQINHMTQAKKKFESESEIQERINNLDQINLKVNLDFSENINQNKLLNDLVENVLEKDPSTSSINRSKKFKISSKENSVYENNQNDNGINSIKDSKNDIENSNCKSDNEKFNCQINSNRKLSKRKIRVNTHNINNEKENHDLKMKNIQNLKEGLLSSGSNTKTKKFNFMECLSDKAKIDISSTPSPIISHKNNLNNISSNNFEKNFEVNFQNINLKSFNNSNNLNDNLQNTGFYNNNIYNNNYGSNNYRYGDNIYLSNYESSNQFNSQNYNKNNPNLKENFSSKISFYNSNYQNEANSLANTDNIANRNNDINKHHNIEEYKVNENNDNYKIEKNEAFDIDNTNKRITQDSSKIKIRLPKRKNRENSKKNSNNEYNN